MIFKRSEERGQDLAELDELLQLPHIDAATKQQIEKQIRQIKAGLKGEAEAAYQINFHYQSSKNWAIIHDLRLEFDGQAAQIDHLLINRTLDMYVCESKHFSEGISINEHGEFTGFFQGKPVGVPSPIEQNNRHIRFLKRLFDSGDVDLPVRLGLRMKPTLFSLILVSNNARINRPGKNLDGLDRIIKNEQLHKRINQDIDAVNLNVLTSAAKIISQQTLHTFAQALAGLHKPLKTDWKARFGIQDPVPQPETVQAAVPVSTQSAAPQTAAEDNPTDENAKHLFCFACKKTVSNTVAQYCWQNKTRFQGRVYCFNCQKNVRAPSQS